MNKTAGIDFGTTNSSIGYSDKEGKAQLISLQSNGSTTDRTSVFYSFEEGGKPVIGEEGFEEALYGERGRLITSPKKFLKSNKLPDIQVLREKYDLKDIISHIISHFKKKLEDEIGEEIDSILVGRPVNFHDTDKKIDKLAENRLREAFIKSGFNNIEFQYEPIGAFNAYANKHQELNKKNNKTLVVDLGGGTSDFSIFDINSSGLTILGNNGIYVGGDNIDEKLILSHYSKSLGKGAKQRLMNGGVTDIPSHVYNEFSDKSRLLFFKEHENLVKGLLPLLINPNDKIALGRLIEVFGDPSIGYKFHSKVENAKIGLTSENQVGLNFNMFKSSFHEKLDRNSFNEIIDNELEKIKQALIETLNISGLKANDIDHIIMNGGTAYIPVIQSIVENILGKGKILKGNTLSSVGYGLTLESYKRFR